VPAAQAAQLDLSPAPETAEYVPAAHFVHAVAAAAAKVPAAHTTQPVAAAAGAEVPDAQGVHAAAMATAEYVPAAHGRQVDGSLAPVAAEYRPATQWVHCVCDDAPALTP
jgi:hypothetical protein